MFASLFRDGGIKWVGLFSYRHMMKAVTCLFVCLVGWLVGFLFCFVCLFVCFFQFFI